MRALTPVLGTLVCLAITAPAQTASFARAERVLSSGTTTQYYGVAVGPAGEVYVAAGGAGVIEFPANAAGPKVFYFHAGYTYISVAVDPATGNVYADAQTGASTGEIDVITPSGSASQLSVDSTTSVKATQIYIANGKVYIAGMAGTQLGGSGVVSVPVGGGASTVISTTAYTGVAADTSGNVYVASASAPSVAVFKSGSSTPTSITGATWAGPEQLAVDAAGNLYVADDTNHVSNNGQLVKVTNPAGTTPGPSQVISTDATFTQVSPYGVAVDANGNIYWTNGGQTAAPNALNEVGTTSASFLGEAAGSTSSATSFVFNVTGSGTFGSPQALTLGNASGDFILGADTCHGALSSGTTCTVSVTFRPSAPGLERGAVRLYNASNAPLATVYTDGTGAGAAVAFAPVRSTLATATLTGPGGVTTDGTYVYVSDQSDIIRVSTAGGLANSGSFPLLGAPSPLDLQLDGAGNLWMADSVGIEEAVRQGDGSYSFVGIAGGATPADLDVDALGNVYIVAGDKNSVLEYPAAGGGPLTIAGASVCNSLCNGLGLDQAGNLYYSVNSVPQKVSAGALNGTANPAATALTGVSAHLDYAFDAAGDLFTVSADTSTIDEYPSQNGVLSTTATALTSEAGATFQGVAVDAAGNVYAADNANSFVVEFQVSTAPALAFGTQADNVASTPKTAAITNSGNAALVFNNPAATFASGTQFFTDASATCLAGASLAAGNSCNLAVYFKPTGTTPVSDTLAISSSATPAPAALALSGTGLNNLPTITLAPPSALTYGSVTNVEITASGTSGTPTGTITWTLDGSAQTGVALSSGAATLVLPATLAVGPHTVVITYPGDSSYTALAGDASETLTFTVLARSVSVSLVGPITKTYDGTTSATLTVTNYSAIGLLAADAGQVNVAAPSVGTYNDPSVALATTVTVTGLSLTGTAAANYTLVATSLSTAATITRAPLGVTAFSTSAVQGTTLPAITGTVTSGQLFGSDTLTSIGITCSTTATSTSATGAYPTTCAGSPANYSPSFTAGTLLLTAAPPAVPDTTVGTTSATFRVSFSFSAATTVASATVNSGGASDYASSNSAACVGSFTAGQTCSVDVSFTPAVPGRRAGAVTLTDNAGNVLQSVYFSGNGLGALISTPVNRQSPTALINVAAGALATDAAGDVFADNPGTGVITEITHGSTQGTTLSLTGAASAPASSLAVDANGTIYLTLPTAIAVLRKTGGSQYTSATPVGTNPAAVAVDGDGNLYYTRSDNGDVHEVTPSGSDIVIATGLLTDGPIAVGGDGSVYLAGAAGVYKKPPSGALSTLTGDTNLGGGSSAVTALALDAAGDVFAAQGTVVTEITPQGQAFAGPASAIALKNALAFDGFGTVYIPSASGQIAAYSTVTAGFGNESSNVSTTLGQSSQTSDTLINAGTAALTFSSFSTGTANFKIDAASTCTTATSLAAGSSCSLTIDFSPTTAPGTLTDTLTIASNSVSNATLQVPLSGTALGSQTITFTPPSSATFGSVITLNATGGASGNPVNFTLSAGNTATLGADGVTLTLTGPAGGAVTITANQAGNAQYSAAPAVTAAINITAAPITVSAAPLTRIFGAPNPAPAETLTGFGPGDPYRGGVVAPGLLSISGSPTFTVQAGPTTNPGSYPILVDTTGMASGYYLLTGVPGTITITSAPQTINWPLNITGPVAPGTTFSLDATATSGLPVTFTVTGPVVRNGNQVTVTGGGIVTITATQAGSTDGSNDYLAAPPVTKTFQTGVATATLSTNALQFGSQQIGTSSANSVVALSSSGGSTALQVASVTVTGPFAITSQCSGVLPVNSSCNIFVSFHPSESVISSGTLTITANDANSPHIVTLTGAGIEPGINYPPSVRFGNQVVGTPSLPVNLVFNNNGTGAFYIASVQVNSGDFAVSPGCNVVPAQASCTLTVTFTPAAVGPRSGEIVVTSPDGAQHPVFVSGTGVGPYISLGSDTVVFPDTLLNHSSEARSVGLSYTGSAPLTGITITPDADFAVDPAATTCTSTLPAANGTAATCNISLIATPTVVGAENGTLTVTDSLGTQSVPLTVKGLAATANLSTDQLSFGSEQVGTASPGQMVTLSNLGSTDLTNLTISTSPGFTHATDCALFGPTTPAGSNCGIVVKFAPTELGPQTGTLTITDSAGTQTVALSGLGQASGLVFSPPRFQILSAALIFQPLYSMLHLHGGPALGYTLLTNNGDVPLHPTINQTGTATLMFGCPQSGGSITLAPGQTCLVGISQPSSGFYQDTLTASDGANVATATGVTTLAGSLFSSPSTLDFGTSVVGAPSLSQTVTFSSLPQPVAQALLGAYPIIVRQASVSDGFIITSNTCSGTTLEYTGLFSGNTCSIDVAVKPTLVGDFNGTLSVSTNVGTQIIVLSGAGMLPAAMTAAPSTLHFGSVPAAAGSGLRLSSAPQTLTLTNPGKTDAVITGLAINGDFSQTNTCGATLRAKSSCAVSVTFSPTVSGSDQGTLSIYNSTSGDPITIALAGFGSPSGLTVTPAALNFGGVKPGQASAPQTITITNQTGGAISSFAVTAIGDYSATGNCGASLADGASCAMQVVLTPAVSDTITGSIYVSGTLAATSGAAIRRQLSARPEDTTTSVSMLGLVALSGSGNPAALDLSASTLTFGAQAAGSSSAAQTVTITNTGGSDLTGLTLTSTPDFPETSNCAATLAAGANCTAAVTFAPTASGGRTGALSLSADGGVSAAVALSGAATGGLLSVNPSSLAFAGRGLGTTSLPQTLTFANTGTAALQLQSVSIAGAGFALSNSTCGTLPATLAPQASCTAAVTFAPTLTTAVQGNVTATSDSGTAFIGLSGSGNGNALTLSSSSFTFGNQGVGLASAAQTLTLTNNSTGDLPIAAITTAGDFSQSNNCGASVAAGASCAVQITYTPTAAGTASGSLTVMDNGQTQPVTLTGTGTNFAWALTAGQSSSLTLNAGESAQLQLALTPGAFSGPVSLSCSGLPAAATCTATPAAVTLSAGGAATSVTVAISTRRRGTAGPGIPLAGGPPWTWLWFGLAPLLAAWAWGLSGRRRRLAFALLLMSALTAAACGGISNELNANGGTPPGTYTAVVMATAGKATQAVKVTVAIN